MRKAAAIVMAFCLFLFPNPAAANLFGDILNKAKQATEKVVTETIGKTTNKSDETSSPGPPPQKTPVQKQSIKQPAKSISYDKSLVRQIQSDLNLLGYNAGVPDGLYGPGTRKAIEQFQLAHGLKVDGLPSQGLLTHLNDAQGTFSKTVSSQAAAESASIKRTPAAQVTLALVRLHHDPSWLDDEERLYQLTTRQVRTEQLQGGGLHGHPPFFDPGRIAGREPQFVARELAPEMRQKLLKRAAKVGPGFVREVELPGHRLRYDFNSQTLTYRGLFLKPADEKERAGLPQGVKDRALYEIPRGPSFKEQNYGIAADIEPSAKLLAFDRILDLEKIPASTKQAEKIAAQDAVDVRLLFRVTDAVGEVVLATVEKFEIRSRSSQAPLLTLGPEHFPSAIMDYGLAMGPPPPVNRSFDEVVISAAEPDLADLLLLRHFPERLNADYLFVLMQERQRFEKKFDNPPWGRFFNPTARTIDRSDLATLGESFKQWTLARAARLPDRVAVRIERQRVNYNPKSQHASLSFSSSSTCLEQRNVMSSGAAFGIAVKSTRDECGEQRYQWKRNPEVVVALDKEPVPPPYATAVERGAKFLPMEIAFLVTGKHSAGSSGKADQLSAALREVRFFGSNDQLLATVKPQIEEKMVAADPLSRAKTGQPFGPDVVGIQLGMRLPAAEAAIRKHSNVRDSFIGKASFPFDGAHLYVLDDGDEYISLFTIKDQHGERVAALERNVWYLPAEAPSDSAINSAIAGKYGQETERRSFPGGFSARWTENVEGQVMSRQDAKRTGCRSLVGSAKSMDVFRKAKGPYVWALPGLDKVWAGPSNGFGIKSDGKSAADIAACGPELVASWSQNNGQRHGPTLKIELYDAPWMRAQAEKQQKGNVKNIGL